MILKQTAFQALQAKLQEEKKRIEADLSRIATATGNGEYETQFEDLGRGDGISETETEQYIDNIAVENTLEQQLHEILEALERIENHSYGVCLKCGQDIALERLEVYPAAKTCVQHTIAN
jgi:RNA polymerase-binding transcription factor DksA